MRITRDHGHIEGSVMNFVVLLNTATRDSAAFALAGY